MYKYNEQIAFVISEPLLSSNTTFKIIIYYQITITDTDNIFIKILNIERMHANTKEINNVYIMILFYLQEICSSLSSSKNAGTKILKKSTISVNSIITYIKF